MSALIEKRHRESARAGALALRKNEGGRYVSDEAWLIIHRAAVVICSQALADQEAEIATSLREYDFPADPEYMARQLERGEPVRLLQAVPLDPAPSTASASAVDREASRWMTT